MDTAISTTASLSSEEMTRLRKLVPLHTLPEDALDELIEVAVFDTVAKGRMLFKQGDTDNENVYLLKGSVALLADKTIAERVRAGSDTARFPLAHQVPRQFSVRAESKVRIIRIDSRRLSDLLARTQKVDYQVADFDAAAEDDWMAMLLQSPVLQQVPPANLQQVIMNVEQVELARDEELIRQGDPGDYYYMLTKGRAVVRRDSGDGKGPCELATLGPGDAFGEEALLSDSPRNSSVTMLQDGEVLRLSKEHFVQLIHDPLLDRIDMETARSKVEQGAIWLDLRSSDQYDELHLPGAINYPFESLRYQVSSLAPDQHYVLYSNAGGRAMAGAFMLTERGFHVSVLQGGLQQDHPVEARNDDQSVPDDDAAAQARIREAEARAHELEERLEQLQRDQENVAAEREQHLQQVRASVDQARDKLVETEEQRREALAAQEKAYAEMEQLTSSLEKLQSERSSLVDRMSEIEGLDKQLQTRLAKAERELIGERERAESATSGLEELSEKLSEAIEKREQEREQHARERGELKEEVTALQMELEQGRLDIGELREKFAQRLTRAAADEAESSELQRRLGDSEEARQALQQAHDSLQAELESLSDRFAQQSAEHEQERTQLQSQLSALQQEFDALGGQLKQQDAERVEHAQLQERLGSLNDELETARRERQSLEESAARELDEARAASDRLHSDFESALNDARTAAQEQAAALAEELERLRRENAALQSDLAAGNEETDAALIQARRRIGELEQQLADEAGLAREQLQARQSELDAVAEQLQVATADQQGDAAALASLHVECEELQRRLSETEQERDTAQAALNKVEVQLAGLESRLSDEQGQAADQLEQAHARVVALEERLAGQADSERQSIQETQRLIDAAETERDDARLRLSELEQRLEDQAVQAGRQVDEKDIELGALRETLVAEQQEKTRLAQALEAAEARHNAIEAALAEAQQAATDRVGLEAELEARLAAQYQESTEHVDAAQAELEQVRRELESQCAKAADLSVELEGLRDDFEKQREEKDGLAGQLDDARSGTEEAVAQLRSEIGELGQRLEQRELALATAREEQRELIEALNAASTERESLLLAMSDRDHEQARLVDLENQVAEALRSHQSDLLAKEQEQQRLREQLDVEAERRATLHREVERLTALLGSADSDRSSDDGRLRAEHAALRQELAQREGEVEQLRGVLEEYVEQIRSAQSEDGEVSELNALRAELEMVREQAIRDAAQMREQLAAAETQKRRLQQADGREAISHEAMRQRIEELESSLAERQRLLADADESRHMLEDAMEDVNQKFDDLSRELEKARADAEAASRDRREAEGAREQLQEALRRLQEDAEEAKVTDLRDDRLKASKRPIGIDSVAPRSRWLPGLLGAGLAIGLLEAVSLLTGRGELISALLGLSGP
jgi:CRP-like cAMP-binding protein/chromosome segregation ATPase